MVTFHAPENALPAFRPLLQQGFGVSIETGASLEDLLCRQWGIDRDYVMGRISTLFLDGKPVDDLPASIVDDGATLALSGAMPGLIGATMRRGGVLAAFRSGISYTPRDPAGANRDGRITVKLFNLLIDELGPRFLTRGIWTTHSRLKPLFPEHPDLNRMDDGPVKVIMDSGAPPSA
jgi:hypothetical protein